MGRLKNKEIAEMLGISTAAVSLALNNKPGVSEETRRRVKRLSIRGSPTRRILRRDARQLADVRHPQAQRLPL